MRRALSVQRYLNRLEKWAEEFGRERLFFIIFGLLAVLFYLPYLVKGGLIYDDWSVWNLGADYSTFIGRYREYFLSFTNRPLAPIYYALISSFKGWYPGYILVDIGCWIGMILVLYGIFKRTFGRTFASLFALLALVPSVSTTVIFSPGMQSIGGFTILIWAWSLWCLEKYCQTGNRRVYFLGYFLILCSLLTYEVSFPLLTFTVLFPLLCKPIPHTLKDWGRYALRYIVPVLVVIFLTLLYQKKIITHFYPDISRFRIQSSQELVDITQNTTTDFIKVLKWEMPRMLLGSITHELTYPDRLARWSVVAAVLLYLATYFTFPRREEGTAGPKKEIIFFLWFLPASIIGVVLLLTAAKATPVTYGYYNRGFTSFAVILAIWSAYVLSRLLLKGRWIFFLVIVLPILSIYSLSFIEQRQNFIHSRELIDTMVNDVQAKLAAAPRDSDKRVYVLANVPEFLAQNYNDETVISTEVLDWNRALILKSNGQISGGATLTKVKIENGQFTLTKDAIGISPDQKAFIPLQETWFYQYNQYDHSSFLVKVQDAKHLSSLIDQVRATSIQPLSVRDTGGAH